MKLTFYYYKTNFRKQDDYEILNKIGQGRYSQVYDGLDIVNNRKVVLKILKPGD